MSLFSEHHLTLLVESARLSCSQCASTSHQPLAAFALRDQDYLGEEACIRSLRTPGVVVASLTSPFHHHNETFVKEAGGEQAAH